MLFSKLLFQMLFSLLLTNILWAEERAKGRQSTSTSTIQPYVPFNRILLAGFAGDDVLFITSSYEFYNVSSKYFYSGGVSLYNASVLPLLVKFAHNSAFDGVNNLTHLYHGITVQKDNTSYLHFAIQKDNSDYSSRMTNLNTSTGQIIKPVGLIDDDWLSVAENDSLVYMVRSKPEYLEVSIAMGVFTWDKGSDIISGVLNVTPYYSICMVDPGNHTQTIKLTSKLPCEFPITWEGPFSGFANKWYIYMFGSDQVYFFNRSLFLDADAKDAKPIVDQFYQYTFNEFFWAVDNGGNGSMNLAINVLIVLVVFVAISLLILIGIIYWQREEEESNDKGERTMRDESRLKAVSKGKGKAFSKIKKRKAKKRVLKTTSKHLPSPTDSQKRSLKTDWNAFSPSSVSKVKGKLQPSSKSSNNSSKTIKSTPKGKVKMVMSQSVNSSKLTSKFGKSKVLKVNSTKSKGVAKFKSKQIKKVYKESSSGGSSQIKSTLKKKSTVISKMIIKTKTSITTAKKVKGDKSRSKKK